MNGLLRRRGAILGGVLVALIACAVFIPRLGAPQAAIWDESYYLTAIQRQVEHRAQFASHPPLGFLLMAAGARLAGDDGLRAPSLGLDKKVAGEDVPATYDYRPARVASAAAGVLGAIAFYGLMLILTGRVTPALLLSNLFTFENAFVVQFRAAQLDGFLVLFIVLALIPLTLALRRDGRAPWLELGFGAAVGLATMIKLAGVFLAFGGVALLVCRLVAWRARPSFSTLAACIASGLTMAAGFVVVVGFVFTWQALDGFRSPDAQSPAGRRDAAFVTPRYAQYLEGQRSLDGSVVLAAAWDDWTYMTTDMAGIPQEDANGSVPIFWPVMGRPILYRWDKMGAETRYVALVGNPVGWALGVCGLIAGLWIALKSASPQQRIMASALLAIWSAVMLCHVVLGHTRVMYLYHYFPGLTLSWSLLAVGVAEGRERWAGMPALKLLPPAVCIAHLAAFLVVAPFSFHTPLTYRQCEVRVLGAIKCQAS